MWSIGRRPKPRRWASAKISIRAPSGLPLIAAGTYKAPRFRAHQTTRGRGLMAKMEIYVLNGPNMNLLGIREPEKYGRATLADVEKLCADSAKRFGLEIVFRQSNREGELIDWIQEAYAKDAAA